MSIDEQRTAYGLSTGSLSGEDEVEGHARRIPVVDEDGDTEGHAGRRTRMPVTDDSGSGARGTRHPA